MDRVGRAIVQRHLGNPEHLRNALSNLRRDAALIVADHQSAAEFVDLLHFQTPRAGFVGSPAGPRGKLAGGDRGD